MVANIFPADPWAPHPNLTGGVKGQNSIFSEHGQVSYQIKWNLVCSNMTPPPTTNLGVGVKGQISSNMAMLHNKLKRIRHAATWQQIFCTQTSPPPPLRPREWVKGQNSTFSEHGHLAYQIKVNHKCSNMVANILYQVKGNAA